MPQQVRAELLGAFMSFGDAAHSAPLENVHLWKRAVIEKTVLALLVTSFGERGNAALSQRRPRRSAQTMK